MSPKVVTIHVMIFVINLHCIKVALVNIEPHESIMNIKLSLQMKV